MNRRGRYLTGFPVLIVAVLLAAIRAGLLGDLDLGRIGWAPTM